MTRSTVIECDRCGKKLREAVDFSLRYRFQYDLCEDCANAVHTVVSEQLMRQPPESRKRWVDVTPIDAPEGSYEWLEAR